MKHQISYSTISEDAPNKVDALIEHHSEALDKYSDRLFWWNKKINLVSRDVSHETIKEHIRHSLLLYFSLSKTFYGRIIDTGTGGGLPGLPLAICLPEKEFVLNDIVSKKVMAAKQISKTLSLTNVSLVSDSIKNVEIGASDLVITKHAFKVSSLVELLHGKNWSEIYFLKGASEAEEELKDISESLSVEIINLDRVFRSGFYEGKGIVKVKKGMEK